MKLPVEWLREFVDTPVDDLVLADKLTMVGLEVEEILSSDDGPVFDMKVTPNRGDWLSVLGAAREAAAAFDVDLRWRSPILPDESPDVRRWAGVLVTDPLLCPRYGGKVIRNVQHGPSPDWMQKRLTAAGMRPIDVVVDITNYVLLEFGQPLHAFDYDKLPEGRVVVRPAREGETIVTLDGVERLLPTGALMICDHEKPACIAGIMGNAESEVTTSTRHIFLEAAHFSPVSIRKTSKLLGLTTEASYRFERVVDPELVPIALERAAELIADLAGGEVVLGRIDLYPNPVQPRTIALRPSRTNNILGTNLASGEIAHSLRRLGLTVGSSPSSFQGEGRNDVLFQVTVPTFRPDLVKEIDLIEEVGRIVGYDTLPETLPRRPGTAAVDAPAGVLAVRLRDVLSGLGMQEIQTHVLTAVSPFDDPAHASGRVCVRQALSAELSGLRGALMPNLLDSVALNLRRRQTDVRLFETGKVFR
ncbi:MAG: phenylalanine--tRNA ligase subunit beta, partial [Capsulimonadaceae bacterium]